MKLTELLRQDLCWVLDGASTRDALLVDLCERIASADTGVDSGALLAALMERERQGSTATPEGVALPHAMFDDVQESFVAVALLHEGVDFQAAHRKPVDMVFVLVGAKDRPWEHLRVLARVARVCNGAGALGRLRGAVDGADLMQRLLSEDGKYG